MEKAKLIFVGFCLLADNLDFFEIAARLVTKVGYFLNWANKIAFLKENLSVEARLKKKQAPE